MRSIHRTRLFVGVGILAVLATGSRMAAANDPKAETLQESIARAQATLQNADANLIKAQAAWIQALYSVRKTHAETAKLLQDVHSKRLDNQMKRTDTFFKKRETRDQYLAKHPRVRPDLETYRRVCSASNPAKLCNSDLSFDGRTIYWPELLQGPEFAPFREELDVLFASRPQARPASEIDVEHLQFQHRVEEVARQMRDQLKDKVHEVSQMEYVAAKNFIMGLAYEPYRASLGPQPDHVAKNP